MTADLQMSKWSPIDYGYNLKLANTHRGYLKLFKCPEVELKFFISEFKESYFSLLFIAIHSVDGRSILSFLCSWENGVNHNSIIFADGYIIK